MNNLFRKKNPNLNTRISISRHVTAETLTEPTTSICQSPSHPHKHTQKSISRSLKLNAYIFMHFPKPYQEIRVTAVDSTTSHAAIYIPWCCFVIFHDGAVVCWDLNCVPEADCRCDVWMITDWGFPSLEAENNCT
jgi:hypothetical protein